MPAFAVPLLRRGDRRDIESDEAAASQTTNEVDVLHQRQWPYAADCAQQVTVDQQALVAIRQRKDLTAPRHQTLQPPGARIVAVEAEAAVARAFRRSGHVGGDFRVPASGKASVGVQQQQPIARCGFHPCGTAKMGRDAMAVVDGKLKVSSMLPPSTTTTSSASGTEASVARKECAAFSAGITIDSMFSLCS